jgi:integrase
MVNLIFCSPFPCKVSQFPVSQFRATWAGRWSPPKRKPFWPRPPRTDPGSSTRLYTLAWTGMRSDEARTLRWAQVNFEAGEIIVGKSKTEAGKGRRMPMSANLKAVLSTYASFCATKLGKLHPDWFVFP